MTSPISGFSPVDALTSVTRMNGAGAATGAEQATGPNADFAGMLSQGLEAVQNAQSKASDLSVQVANGTLADPAQYTMASTEAALGLQLTMAIRNKAVEAFQEIMRMQA